MSGAAGHILHPFEDFGMTFGDMLSMFRAVSEGHVSLYEKYDGVNLCFKVIAGELRIARTWKECEAGGLPVEDLLTRFPNAPDVGRYTYEAMTAFEDILQTYDGYPEPTSHKMWYSLDVCSTAHHNVVRYAEDLIVLHPVIVTPFGTSFDKLNSIFYSRFVESGRTRTHRRGWTVVSPPPWRYEKYDPYIEKDLLFAWEDPHQFRLLGEVYQKRIFDDFMTFGFDNETAADVSARIMKWGDYKSLTEINRGRPKVDSKRISEYVKDEAKILRAAYEPVEAVTRKFAARILAAAPCLYIADKELARQRLAYFSKLNKLSAASVKRVQRDIDAAGELEEHTAPIEGVVFCHYGATYKLTGAFRHINQVMGMERYLSR